MMRPVNRITPQLPPTAMKTYHAARPMLLLPGGRPGPGSHWRDATCQEVNCPSWRDGWRTVVDVARPGRGGLPSGRAQANYIRMKSGRHFSAEQVGDLVTFTFPAGQTCFGRHRLPVGREPLFSAAGGDWRGNPLGIRTVRFRSGRQFVDDFGEHQLRLADRFKKG